jgi:hypothetical protein
MPCIISWAPALRARPPQDVGQSLLTVALRRLTEPSTRKIAAQEPPSSAGHNDVPHADLARVSMGRDAGQGAYLAAFLSTALDARSPSSSGAAGQFDSVRIASSW